MEPVERHVLEPDASFDGGDLDCGNGLLLLIRQHMDPLERGGLLEFRSTEISVEADFPAWCRMTGNELVSWTKHGKERSFLVCKGALADRRDRQAPARGHAALGLEVVPVTIPSTLPPPAPAPRIPALAVMGVGSWPQEFEREMQSLDVPAAEVRHPAVFGPLGRREPLAREELEIVRAITDRPVKIALPGPYLLTRMMWMECITDRAYRSREHLAGDIVRVLREEIHDLLAAGVALVQLDEPVLSEVVFTGAKNTRSFMCGALSEKGDSGTELEFARTLINQVVAGLPRAHLGLHVCRGNWTPDERVALTGDYRPLLGLLGSVDVGTLFLELATPRAGGLEILAELPHDRRIGIGVVNQKRREIETVEEVVARGRRAIDLLGEARVLLTPDCGFATFADNPVASPQIAEAKLRVIVEAAERLRKA